VTAPGVAGNELGAFVGPDQGSQLDPRSRAGPCLYRSPRSCQTERSTGRSACPLMPRAHSCHRHPATPRGAGARHRSAHRSGVGCLARSLRKGMTLSGA
jgi:hypothetical protein